MMRRAVLLPLVLGLVAMAILIGLGTWQLQRLQWKEQLVAYIAARVSAAPEPVPAKAGWPNLDMNQWEYRPVEVRGTFLADREVRVYTLLGEPKGAFDGPGYWIMTPLELADAGGTIIVNRGFVPLQHGDLPRADTSADLVTVRGLLRAPEDRNSFTPKDEPAKRLFYARDPAAIGTALQISEVAPFTVDASDSGPGGLPQAGETRLAFSNRHLEYALTWYGLAGALAAVLAVFLWRMPRAR